MSHAIVNLFGGPGGCDEGLRELGHEALGIEWDAAACATRIAAGHPTLQADVAELDPMEFAPLTGLMGSPPCQAYSTAGKSGGRRDKEHVIACAHELAAGEDTRAEHGAKCEDARSMLVVEPLRWALALRPEWVALEQVPPVLELWTLFASLLDGAGYRTAAGILSAERYGVPQTRERAILLASRVGPVSLPTPTHQRYIAPRREKQAEGLFDAGERSRIVLPEDRHLLPWVSMAEALGWVDGKVGFPRTSDGRDVAEGEHRERDFRSTGEPAFNVTEKARSWCFDPRASMGEGMIERHGPRDPVPADAPAPVITSKARSAEWTLRNGNQDNAAERAADEPAATLFFGGRLNEVTWRSNAQPNAATRQADEPAPTIKGGHDSADRQWIVDTGNTRGEGTPKTDGRQREADEPAPAVTSRADQLEWRGRPEDLTEEQAEALEQPAPTIVGTRKSSDGLIVGRQLPPGQGRNVGGRDWKDGAPSHLDTRQSHAQARSVDDPSPVLPGQNLAKGATVWTDDPATETTEGTGYKPTKGVRVTVQEAAVLQGFRPDYPWQGSRTKQFEQVGNAVPPPLARAYLSELVEPVEEERAA